MYLSALIKWVTFSQLDFQTQLPLRVSFSLDVSSLSIYLLLCTETWACHTFTAQPGYHLLLSHRQSHLNQEKSERTEAARVLFHNRLISPQDSGSSGRFLLLESWIEHVCFSSPRSARNLPLYSFHWFSRSWDGWNYKSVQFKSDFCSCRSVSLVVQHDVTV